MNKAATAALTRVRKLCLALPDASERASHGAPAFFWRGKSCFVMFLDDHHGDGRLALWCVAPRGAQGMLVESDPEVFFVPPYVGPSGWVGVRLDRGAKWPMIAEVITQAYETRRAKKPRPQSSQR
jgi:hypothetical protein